MIPLKLPHVTCLLYSVIYRYLSLPFYPLLGFKLTDIMISDPQYTARWLVHVYIQKK